MRAHEATWQFESTTEVKPHEAHRFCVAPMMEWTDRHCRVFHRQLSRRARLYTEMITTAAVLHGPRDRLLGFSAFEHPLALQLGGSDPGRLAEAARIAEDRGYDEINLNVGCPSDRVQGGAFGACLMRTPALVGACVAAMKQAVRIPVTVKCRIGVDEQDPEAALNELAEKAVEGGVDGLIVHARKAWLAGLSPRQNREAPPLDHARVHRLKQSYGQIPIVINGGIVGLEEARRHLAHVDGVMLGRAAYQNPDLLRAVDPLFFGQTAPFDDSAAAVEAFMPYLSARLSEGVRLHTMTRHLLGLFAGRAGARAYRRHLATQAVKPGAGVAVLRQALEHVRVERRAA